MRGEVKEVYKFLTMTLISLMTDPCYELRCPNVIFECEIFEIAPRVIA